MPLVSVIIPTWNRASSLVAAVLSALQQDVIDIEVLVCDDGSTDDSQARIAALNDARVRWIAGAHAGRPSIPRNRGIAASRGRWVAFLDSDDLWMPDKLGRQLHLAEQGRHAAVCSNASRFNPGEGITGPLLHFDTPLLRFSHLVAENRVITSSLIATRDLIVAAGGFPEQESMRVGEDYALWLKLSYRQPIAVLDLPLVKYTDDPQHSVRRFSPSARLQRQLALADFVQHQAAKGARARMEAASAAMIASVAADLRLQFVRVRRKLYAIAV